MFFKKNQTTFLILVIIVAIIAAVFDYQPLWQKISSFRPWTLGLDLAGGSYLIYDIDLSQTAPSDRSLVVNGLRDVIEKRVNFFGVSEPRVYTETAGEHSRLIVELAGIKDISEAIKQIGATPLLDFREVEEEGTSTPKFILTNLTGRYIKSARLAFDSVTRAPQVELEFNDEGAKIFEELTLKNVGKPLAIFLDNQLIEMPVVKEKISGGKAQITGKFSLEAARQLVERFNAGALPAPINLINQQTIDATLGENALSKAIIAGLFGTLAIIIFMLSAYRRLGLFASLALLIYISLVLGIFKVVPVTMSLAGIAGFILSIGMAVDANILIFARTNEERKKGLSWQAAIEEGFRRAWPSIRDSNISTLITTAILYNLTSGFVRGFALTLFIGVIVSMFSAIVVTYGFLKTFMLKSKI